MEGKRGRGELETGWKRKKIDRKRQKQRDGEKKEQKTQVEKESVYVRE